MIKKTDSDLLKRYLDKLEHIKHSSHVILNETEAERKNRIEFAKKDYAFCVNYYFPHYATSACADFQIEAANFIKKYRECVDVEAWARAHAKSTHIDIMIPFWLWLNNEIDVMVLIGKNADDAKTLLSDLQAEFESNPQIIADFGEQRSNGSWEEGQFVTKNEVAFFSLGRGQSPRGIRYKNKRPNLIVFDDIDDDEIVNNLKRVLKVVKWIFSAVYGAMDNKGARVIFANNIISTTGIIAFVIKKITALGKKNKSIRVNVVNALDANGKPRWHQKYTKQFFREKQAIMGDYNFQTEYMNNPQTEGKIFLDEQIQWAIIPNMNHFDCIVGHWDVAYSGTETGDYNAIKIWGLKDKNFYCIKAFVRQCKMGVAMKWMADYEASLPTSVKIHWRFESQFWNDAIKMTLREVNELQKNELLLTQCERPVKNKFDRIVSLQPYFQNGRCYFNKKEEFNLDMQVGINQLKAIEPGYNSHDDAPDADEGAISYLARFIPSNNPLPLIGNRHKSRAAW
jgi:predicted phage terminase large subunit-like protein